MLDYTVTTFRNAGLQAKWIKQDGRPYIAVRDRMNPLSTWLIVDHTIRRSIESGHLGSIKDTIIKWQQFNQLQPIRQLGEV